MNGYLLLETSSLQHILFVAGYLLASGKQYYALALLGLIAPQVFFQVKLSAPNIYLSLMVSSADFSQYQHDSEEMKFVKKIQHFEY